MKKNKTVAFALATALLVGGTFMGTKAWFTDSAEVSNDLIVSIGNLDLEIEEVDWRHKRENPQESETMPLDTENVRPGDWFEKEVTVTNTGSLDQIITFETALDDMKIKDANWEIEIETELEDGDRLNTNQSKDMIIKVKSIPSELKNDDQEKDFNFAELSKAIVIKGEQVNYK